MITMGRCALVVFAALCAPSWADTPLRPAEDWQQILYSGTVVDADVTGNTVTIRPVDGAAWSLPYTYPFGIQVAPNGLHALLPSGGDGLLPWNGDPDMTVLYLYQAPGQIIGTVSLGSLVDPRDLERTVSHYVWVSAYAWASDGWDFTTPDGQNWHLGTNLNLSRN